MKRPVIVQTGSVPALLWLLRRYRREGQPVRVAAVDSENVRQYLREIPAVETRYFGSTAEAVAIVKEWGYGSTIDYLGGRSFLRLQRKLRQIYPDARAVHPEQAADWSSFLWEFQERMRRDSVLLLASEEPDFIEEYLAAVFPKHRLARPSLCMLCRQQDLAGWRQRHPDWRFWNYVSARDLLALAPRLRRQKFDAAVVFFSGRAKFFWLKLLSLACGARQRLAVNEHMRFFQLTPGSLAWFGFQRLLYDRPFHRGARSAGYRVLVVQTWDDDRMRRIVDRLHEVRPFYKPRYFMFTRQDKAAALAGAHPFEQVYTYPVAATARNYWATLKNIRSKRFDAAVVAFTQEPTFRKLKWLPFLCGIRDKLIFNRHYDCFFFTPGNLLKYWAGSYCLEPLGGWRSWRVLFWLALLPAVRGFLFPFRFSYLVIAVTGMKLRRAYTLHNSFQRSRKRGSSRGPGLA
ncbi:MAG: hypothetical protein HYX74_10555 [Acidobacteria bacterium]|nr:hypothetical protein [Acidobacteriota bacterium]